MKKLILFMMLCCITALLAPPEVRAQSAQTVNESGGTGLNDGLKFVVNTNGALAVYRDNRTQYYNGYDWSDVSSRGSGVSLTFRFSKGSTYSPTAKSLQVCSTTPVVKTGNTYKTSISGYVESSLSSDRFFVTLDVTYTHPNTYFIVDYIVRSPSTLSATGQTVHMYLDHDAMILGCDASNGYKSSNSTGSFVGDYRPSTCSYCPGPGNLTSIGKFKNPSSHGFKVKNGFRSYYTGYYGNRSTVNSTLELSNTYTTEMTDDGIAVEFTAGPFNQANQTLVRSVAHCYGNNQTEFDNLAINVPAAPAVSTPVTISFASAEFSETEGNHATQNVKIIVSDGTLASDQVCSFTVSGGTAVENTDYTYVKGVTIPAGNYSNPQEITLTNVTIKDNSSCNENKWLNISIDEPSLCNDMLIRGSSSTARIVIVDDEVKPEITTSLQNVTYNTSEVVPPIELASNVAGATITWTNSNPAIGLAAGGTGNIPSFTATNTTASPVTATISVKATKECTGETKTFTITVNSKFNITYDYNGGVAPATANPTEFLVASLPLNITNAPARTGYTFAGWTCEALGITTPESPFTIPAGTTQNLTLVADWGSGANVYNIEFKHPAGIINPNADRTYTYEDNVTIADPTIPGFTFNGWTIINDEASSPVISPVKNVSWTQHTVYGNLQFSVAAPDDDITNWTPIDYRITYDYNSGVAPSTANPTTYNALTETIHLNAPTRNGYTFRGWSISSSEPAVTFLPLTQTIPTGAYGNLTCTANWGENTYTISYELNGAAHSQTPTAYSYTEQVAIADPTLAGYTFTGWTITNTESASPAITPAKNVVFGPSTVFGNLTFAVAAPSSTGGGNGNWNQITYNITYNLNGGSYGARHPNTYKVTDDVSIDIPVRTAYTFAGWTVTSDSVSSPLPTSGNPTTTFGRSNGVYGNLTFTANWSTDDYTITYNAGASDASFTNNTNPGTYDIEDTPITLTDAGAKRNGYTFDKWTITSDAAGVTVPDGMSVPAGTHGNLSGVAKWTVNNYNIAFNVPPTVVNPNSNRSYTYEDNIAIADPTVPGYTFLGWTIVNDSLSSPLVAPIHSAWSEHTVYGNLIFSVTDPATPTDPTTGSPNWGKITYSITYDLNGGAPPATANPTQYDAQTAISLNDPSRTAYTFLGWTITSDSAAVTFPNPTISIPAGSYGNLTCTANWGINTYTIAYNVAAGVTHSGTPRGYSFTDMVEIENPTITGWTFTGWTISNDSISSPAITPAKDISWTPGTIFGNLTLTVTDPNTDDTNWTKTKYAVTYNLNSGTGAIPTDTGSPYVWGTTITVLGKTNSMTRTNATFIGWSNAPELLVTTQAQEDGITKQQAGDTFVLPIGGKTLYAVWATDAGGPDGVPDGIPDYKQVTVNYLPSSSVTASSGTYPANVMFNPNTQGTVSG
ncbi:MAG: InlB B-repeat-containing protein, partial [Tannerella sp.]|nr:InlB B-repeat-containing protein [Tannerella sp.]